MDPESLAESASLHRRARAFVDETADFDALACDLARFQAARHDGFARLCAARGVDPRTLQRAAAIPPVPTDAFKLTRVATFPPADAVATFRTSGTTIGRRGVHALRDISTYDHAAVAFGKRWLARDVEKLPVLAVMPSPAATPDSSLVHMCARFGEAFGTAVDWLLDDDVIDLSRFDERVSYALARNTPVLVLATSFALVHLLDALGGDGTFVLPRGSRVMQTGGFKGKVREVAPAHLRAEVARVFGIAPSAIVSEYGMTELSSQFYERSLFEGELDVYAEPPWARVVPVDPISLAELPDGEIGIAKIIDLMNVDSAVAVLAQDRVRRVDGGFVLLGRAPGAPPRGCSIAIDEMLGPS